MSKLLKRRRRLVLGIISSLLMTVVIAGSWRFRSRIRAVYNIGRTLATSPSMANDDSPTNVLFIHQSTGRNLITEGSMRKLFAEAGYDFWDHDYNYIGLTEPSGTPAGYSYNIPNDNTDPEGYAELFAQPLQTWPINAFSAIMQHDIVIFKSCYPVSDIDSPAQLEAYRRAYRRIRDVADRHLEKIFVALTPPPLVPESSNPENALRAREFATWLQSDEFLTGHSNFHVFDLFGQLAEGDPSSEEYNRLRAEYRPDAPRDSHPNSLANQTIGPQLVDFVISAAENYQVAP